MPYRCRDCKGYFSAKTGTALEASNVPMRKWAFATYPLGHFTERRLGYETK